MSYRISYRSRADVRALHPTIFESVKAAEQGIRTLTAIFGDRAYKVVPS